MRLALGAVVGLLCLIFVNALSADVLFLEDFFRDREEAVTLTACWTKAKTLTFAKSLAMNKKLNPVGAHLPNANSLKEWPNNNYIVLDLRNCETSDKTLTELDRSDVFSSPLKFLLLTEKNSFNPRSFNFSFLPSSEVIVAIFDGGSAILTRPYRVGRFSELSGTVVGAKGAKLNVSAWERYGNWSVEGGLHIRHASIIRSRSDLKGVKLVAAVVFFENDTWNHLTDYRFPGIDTFTKQDFESMRCVFEYLNVSYIVRWADGYGYYNEVTKSFDGLVHEIQSGRADVSAVSLYMTHERFQAVDFIKMGNPLGIRFLVKKPSKSSLKNIFLITLTRDVWIAIIIVMVIFSAIFKLVLSWEVHHTKISLKQDRFTASDVTLIALEAVCQQGSTTEPFSYSGRIISLIFFGSFMFIFVSYSANIVVLLQSSSKIENLQQLLDSRIEAAGENTPYMQNYFERIETGVLHKLYVKKIRKNRYYPLDEGMKLLKEGNFAFHVVLQAAYQHILENFTNYEVCGLQELPGFIEENVGHIVLPKRSPYKDLFKVALLKVDEYGIQRRTNLRVVMKPRCFSNVASFKSVGIYDCYQAFILWGAGGLLAFFIFLLERLRQCFSRA